MKNLSTPARIIGTVTLLWAGILILSAAVYNQFSPGGALSGTWNSQNVNVAAGTPFITGTLPAGNGGTGSAFTAFAGPNTSVKTLTLPNANATLLSDANAVTLAQGGTGLTSAADDTTLISSGSAWVASAIPNCTDTGGNHLNYTASTNTLSCGTSGGSSATSGITSPSCTADTNVATCAATANGLYYQQIGTIVTGGFSVQIDPTSTGTTRARVSIPVSSNFAAATDAAGVCNTDTSTQTSAVVLTANATNDDFFITWTTIPTSNLSFNCNFAYKVL